LIKPYGHSPTRQELRLRSTTSWREPNGTSLLSLRRSAYSTEAVDDLKALAELHRDLSEASYPTLYNTSTFVERTRPDVHHRLINETIPAASARGSVNCLTWLQHRIRRGVRRQSALNLIYLLATILRPVQPFGASNEKYHVRGGTTRSSPPGGATRTQIVTGTALIARGACRWHLHVTFQSGRRAFDVTATKSCSRCVLDSERSEPHASGLGELKMIAIRELAMARTRSSTSSSAAALERARQQWRTYADGIPGDWEVTRGQPGTRASWWITPAATSATRLETDPRRAPRSSGAGGPVLPVWCVVECRATLDSGPAMRSAAAATRSGRSAVHPVRRHRRSAGRQRALRASIRPSMPKATSKAVEPGNAQPRSHRRSQGVTGRENHRIGLARPGLICRDFEELPELSCVE